MNALRFGVIYGIVAIYLVSLWLGGWYLLAVPLVSFGLIPGLDELLPKDRSEPERRPLLHDLVLRLYVPVHFFAMAAALWKASSMTALELPLMALALGVLTGAGAINVAHELMHRADKVDKGAAELLMLSASYPWFCVEHVLGHHRWVATPKDPATARLGETLYRFLPRTLLGGLRSFWSIERDVAARRGIPWYSLRDRRTRYALELIALYAALSWLGGPVVGLFLAQSAVAVLLLEVINYVEHYGLMREEVRPGEFERVKPEHSWNSHHVASAALLFNLPRHADHHAHASRPYHQLRAWPGAPELPLGYPAMVLLALVPPLWFRLMDGRAQSAGSSPTRA